MATKSKSPASDVPVLSEEESRDAAMSEQVSAAAEVGAHVPDSATLNARGKAKRETEPKATPAPKPSQKAAAKKASAPKAAAKVEPKVEPKVEEPGRGRTFVLISLTERDAVLADGPKAVKDLMSEGVSVRRENGAPLAQKFVDQGGPFPQYYSRFWFRLALTPKQRETLALYLDRDLDEAAPTATKVRRSSGGGSSTDESKAEAAALAEAKALVAKIDAMPGPESVKAMGTDEAQAAMELVGASIVKSYGDMPF